MITQAKKNFIDRLFGRTDDASKYQPSGKVQGQPAPSGFVPDFLPNYVGPATIPPTVQQQNVPNSQVQVTPQQEQPAQSGSPGTKQSESRYKFMELFQPEPERDEAMEEIIKKRAKMNAFGSGISALAGLTGMAAGGDAPAMPDLQTPWNMEQIQRLDNDYRGRLQDWIGRKFQVDAANNQIQNREIDQTIDAENRMGEIQERGAQAKELAEQRAQQALEQLKAKSQADQIKEMQKIGVDPNSPNAYEEYLKKNRQKFNTDIDYKNRIGRGSSGRSGQGTPYDLAILQKGKQLKYDELNKRLSELTSDPSKAMANESQIKLLQEEIKKISNYNPGANELTDMELAQLGSNYNPETPTPQGEKQPSVQFDPTKGAFSNVPGKNDPVIKQRLSQGFQKAATNIDSFTREDLSQMIQDLIAAGEAPNAEKAYEIVEAYIRDQHQNK